MKQSLYISSLLLLISISSYAQEKVVQYYDSAWGRVSPEQAVYRTEFIKDGNVYRCNSYWKATGIIWARSTFADTVFGTPLERQITYYKETGNTLDSAILDDKGKPAVEYVFYPDKKLHAIGRTKPGSSTTDWEGFEKNGKKIDGFIFLRDASFKNGGDEGWQKYLSKKASKDLWLPDDGKDINVTVHIIFRISKYGNVSRASVHKSSGIKQIDNDAVSVILASPEWTPRIYLNETTEAVRIQPITYQIPSKKKK